MKGSCMRVGLLLAVAGSVLLLACSGGEERAPAAPGPELAEVRAVVPPGWSLDDWAVSQDGAYVVLATTGPERVPGWRSSVVSVYRWNDETPVEAARLSACCGPAERKRFGLLRADDILAPDDSGTRRLSLERPDGTAMEQSVTVSIEASGKVTISEDREPPDPSWPQVIEGSEVTDPLALVEVTTEPWWGGISEAPIPATATPHLVTVPAGAIPVGWKVSQAVWSADHHYLAVVTVYDIDSQLSIYGVAGGELRELWREMNRRVTLDEELSFRDVNGDGDLDIVYNTGTGGNGWTMWPTLAASLTDNGQAKDLSFRLPIEDSSPTKPVDLDGDGIYEWLAIDASWEDSPFGHADSPASRFVLAWDGHEYVDATERYAEAVDDARLEIVSQSGGSAQLDPRPPSQEASCREKRLYLRDSVARYLDYFNSRRPDQAERILTALREYPSFGSLSPARDRVVETLARNPRYPGQPGDFPVCLQ